MQHRFSLAGQWALCCDPSPCQQTAPPSQFPQTMTLPGTTAGQAIGSFNAARETGFLTERYPFTGRIWLRRVVHCPHHPMAASGRLLLLLERTRRTQLWVNGTLIGAQDSLCTPHCYDLTAWATEPMELILAISNEHYPTRGGHMTAPDTQTNWIGVTGTLELVWTDAVELTRLRAFPQVKEHSVTVTGHLRGWPFDTAEGCVCNLQAVSYARNAPEHVLSAPEHCTLTPDADGDWSVTIPLPDAPLWSADTPVCVRLTFSLPGFHSSAALSFGMRNCKAERFCFTVNDAPIFLRGKHDALAFPLEGAAPTTLDAWLRVFAIAKEWGINHYRFHTCCPPEACFAAADLMGIYLMPELPFWGTLYGKESPEYPAQAVEQQYLIEEGRRILETFGNHPSFCFFSLGNELWGGKERLHEILAILRAYDPRPLYTQGSNNYQHMPLSLPQDDFWSGVRLGKGKLLRGSFATCDAPLGRIQTDAPSTDWDYESLLYPSTADDAAEETADAAAATNSIEIQYETGVKTVAVAAEKPFHPTIPVVTHEIGQYSMYPDFSEIPRYTGVLAARNLEVFRERLTAAGMGMQAADFFRCSGLLARDCYQMELEAAFRSPHLAGFQLLDLQDYPGQGTALVGMLNALLESKGLIAAETWRGFCGDCVLLGRFDRFVWVAGSTQTVQVAIRLAHALPKPGTLHWSLTVADTVCAAGKWDLPALPAGYSTLQTLTLLLPRTRTGRATLALSLPQCACEKNYPLTIFPAARPLPPPAPMLSVVHTVTDALPLLAAGRRVLLLPRTLAHALPASYCTDFWCYPMFRTISESMGKPIPVGTLGLCVDDTHPIAQALWSDCYTTPQWFTPLQHAVCAILDDAPAGYRPIVQMIDNVERNHRLGLVFEAAVGTGALLVCTIRLQDAPDDPAMCALARGIYDYLASAAFAPATALSGERLLEMLAQTSSPATEA